MVVTEVINILEKAIIVGVDFGQTSFHESMSELKQLVVAAGAEVVFEVSQKRDKPNSKFYIGQGKVHELKELSESMDVNTIVFNHELSGSQLRNIEEVVECKIIDRSRLILDIFATRATSKEGKLQVQLANLLYRLPRLSGFYSRLSRVAGGIGTRGLGEQQLELDRRVINKEIHRLKGLLKKANKVRLNTRTKRAKAALPLVSLVGYTNAGKSTILNQLVTDDKKVFAEDMLFATLDTAVRKATLLGGQPFLISDTVGFVSDLPTFLIESFKSTLEEVTLASLIVIVLDASSANIQHQLDTTWDILKQLDVLDKPILVVTNKIDLIDNKVPLLIADRAVDHVAISAQSKGGIEVLLQKIGDILIDDYREVSLLIPYDHQDRLQFLNEKYRLDDVEYQDGGIFVRCLIDIRDVNRLVEYLV